MSPEEELRQTIAHIQAVSQRYLNGEPAPFQACWSHADDVTIFGAWGAYERGWAQVGPRLEWGAARYRGGHTDFELLALAVSGDLGYTVCTDGTAFFSRSTSGVPAFKPRQVSTNS